MGRVGADLWAGWRRNPCLRTFGPDGCFTCGCGRAVALAPFSRFSVICLSNPIGGPWACGVWNQGRLAFGPILVYGDERSAAGCPGTGKSNEQKLDEHLGRDRAAPGWQAEAPGTLRPSAVGITRDRAAHGWQAEAPAPPQDGATTGGEAGRPGGGELG
jgi:hypothetical protein